MKVREIYNLIDEIAPFESAVDYDNVGIMLGSEESDVTGIVICLDISEKVIFKATKEKCNLIITHHPLIFTPIKRFNYVDPDANLLAMLIKCDINVIVAHTNFDKCEKSNGMEMAKRLGASKAYVFEMDNLADVAIFDTPLTFEEFSKRIDLVYKDKYARKYKNNEKLINNAIIIGGAGGRDREFLLQICNSYDILVTSEIKYSNILLAKKLNFNIIEVGHENSEIVFLDICEEYMKEKLRNYSNISIVPIN